MRSKEGEVVTWVNLGLAAAEGRPAQKSSSAVARTSPQHTRCRPSRPSLSPQQEDVATVLPSAYRSSTAPGRARSHSLQPIYATGTAGESSDATVPLASSFTSQAQALDILQLLELQFPPTSFLKIRSNIPHPAAFLRIKAIFCFF